MRRVGPDGEREPIDAQAPVLLCRQLDQLETVERSAFAQELHTNRGQPVACLADAVVDLSEELLDLICACGASVPVPVTTPGLLAVLCSEEGHRCTRQTIVAREVGTKEVNLG
jgi:hypothetical protein